MVYFGHGTFSTKNILVTEYFLLGEGDEAEEEEEEAEGQKLNIR